MAGTKQKKRILVVDDEKNFLEVTNTVLSSAGYETHATSDATNILKVVRKVMPDLIILDVIMPKVDGFLVKTELNKNPATAGIPVIFLTVKHEIPERVKGFNLGADDYIVKPFNAEELLARIDAILNKKSFYEKLSMTDALTDLYNIRFFKRQFTLFFNTAKRYKKVFSLAIMDIDDFKNINDTQGHAAGDFILIKFASIARQTLRESDVLMRYGGDEFIVIMPETNNKQAAGAITRLKNIIKNKMFMFHDTEPGLTFSISAGIATYNPNLTNESQMFNLADQRLYEDKMKK